MKETQCIVPYSQAFIRPDGQYRDCCSSTPHVIKFEKNFNDWWTGPEMEKLRTDVSSEQLPRNCQRCTQHEGTTGTSMRISANKDNANFDINSQLPNRYQIAFGNLCNLGCWSCEENLSSVIQEEKRKLKILPENYVDPSIGFNLAWPSLRDNILASYNEHEEVLINIWGGEPTISKEFVEFLELLVERGLSHRTRIEMFSNCHSPKPGFQELLENNKWAHITILASLDAVGPASEWIRYGSKWNQVENNFIRFKDIADYIEIQCTLSVLTARHLPELMLYGKTHNTTVTPVPLQDPWYMSPAKWDGDIEVLGSQKEYEQAGLLKTWELYGSEPESGSSQTLKYYINQFTNRSRETPFNPALDQLISGE